VVAVFEPEVSDADRAGGRGGDQHDLVRYLRGGVDEAI
jgi:hypothetical protein